MTLSESSQDYLKAIYQLTNQHGRATTSQIAQRLEVKPASVTGMLQKLSQVAPPLVTYEKHQGAVLTAEGEEAALEMVRHHRLIELFLHEILGYAWDEVHEEAERLEHVISEKMERRIAEVLDHPLRDPHGQQIPTRDLELSPSTEFALSKLRPPQRAVVRRVQDEDAALLRHFEQIGLLPAARLAVQEYVPFDGNLRIEIEGRPEPIVLGPVITEQVYVDVLEGSEVDSSLS